MINGAILVGASERRRAPFFRGVNPATGEEQPLDFSTAGPEDVSDACALAEAAFEPFAALEPSLRAAFLDRIAHELLEAGEGLVQTACAETGLPPGRIEGERGRTVGQLRLLAAEIRRGAWLDVTIDTPLPDRAPAPRPDLRRMNAALGPVAVFGAANFPLAFSVAGGDTAAALAAGCPVVVKGHPAHPGTGELAARAIGAAVKACGLADGVFSYLPGADLALGGALVADPRIKAVGFTGSRAGGLALMEIAARRPEPIPVYAEMSSVNPVVLMPWALKTRPEALARGFIGSLLLGAGQFCTSPGVVIALEGPGLDRFIAQACDAIRGAEAQVMLSAGIHANYAAKVGALAAHGAVRVLARSGADAVGARCAAALFETDADGFVSDAALGHEVFGAASLIVRCRAPEDMARVLSSLEGQLTATIHFDAADEPDARPLLPILRAKAGRILANGWPTGVEVSAAMVHGGPFPASSDLRTTSVGALAIARFVRPVCYQDMPDALLPPALKAANPWRAPRTVDLKRESPE